MLYRSNGKNPHFLGIDGCNHTGAGKAASTQRERKLKCVNIFKTCDKKQNSNNEQIKPFSVSQLLHIGEEQYTSREHGNQKPQMTICHSISMEFSCFQCFAQTVGDSLRTSNSSLYHSPRCFLGLRLQFVKFAYRFHRCHAHNVHRQKAFG